MAVKCGHEYEEKIQKNKERKDFCIHCGKSRYSIERKDYKPSAPNGRLIARNYPEDYYG